MNLYVDRIAVCERIYGTTKNAWGDYNLEKVNCSFSPAFHKEKKFSENFTWKFLQIPLTTACKEMQFEQTSKNGVVIRVSCNSVPNCCGAIFMHSFSKRDTIRKKEAVTFLENCLTVLLAAGYSQITYIAVDNWIRDGLEAAGFEMTSAITNSRTGNTLVTYTIDLNKGAKK